MLDALRADRLGNSGWDRGGEENRASLAGQGCKLGDVVRSDASEPRDDALHVADENRSKV